MGTRTWKRLLLVTAVLLGFTLVMTRFSKEVFVPETVKRQVEVVSLYTGSGRVLAAELKEDGSLFGFSLPENYKEADRLRPGMILEITGPDGMKMTYPGQLDDVKKVKITGERPDFIAKYLDSLEAEYGDKDREERWAAVRALEDLNDQEKRGLWYLLECRDLE